MARRGSRKSRTHGKRSRAGIAHALAKLTVRRPSAHGGYGWIRDLPDDRDFVYGAPLIRFPQGLPPSVDLRSECPPVYDQGQLGCCTGNGIAGAIEFDQRAAINGLRRRLCRVEAQKRVRQRPHRAPRASD
jgi:hypothetical protein